MRRTDPVDAKARFEALYHSTWRDLLAYLLRRTGNAQDAADALAETYLIAWEKLDRVPSGDDARLWLFGVARNVFHRGLRRGRVATALVDRLAAELRTSPAMNPPSSHKVEPGVQRALANLEERDREILTLAAWEELSPSEIAKVLRISPNLVRVRLHRARSRIKRDLDGESEQIEDADLSPARGGPRSAILRSSR